MKHSKSFRLAMIAGGLVVASAGVPAGFAGSISGSIWVDTWVAGYVSDPNVASLGRPDATFSVDDINFQSPNSHTNYTPSGFLSSETGDNFSGFSNTVFGFHGNQTLDNSVLQLTGKLYLTTGDNLTVAHDDGAVLKLAGYGDVINSPGPTTEITNSYKFNGPTGIYAYTLDYSEISGAPADLIFRVDNRPPTAAPESSTTLLLVSGLGLAGFSRLRRARA